jgi:CRP-like cAMP-binding protein
MLIFGHAMEVRRIDMSQAQLLRAQLVDRGLNPQELIPRAKTFRRGEMIPLSPDRIWFVDQGIVQISTLYPSGDESLIAFAFAGMPFGTAMTQVDPYHAMALTNAALVSLSIVQIQQHLPLQDWIGQQVQRRLRQSEALIAMLGYRRVEDRLRQLLILLAGEIGETTTDGIKIAVRLTHQLIANTIGSTRVTTTRLLGELQREGWLTINRQHHIILRRSLMEPHPAYRTIRSEHLNCG